MSGWSSRLVALAGAAALLTGCGGGGTGTTAPRETTAPPTTAPTATVPATTATPGGTTAPAVADWTIAPASVKPPGLPAAAVGGAYEDLLAAWGAPVGCNLSPDCTRLDGPDTVGYRGINVDVDGDGATELFTAYAGAWRTPDGATIGTPLAMLERMYGARLEPVTQNDFPGRDPTSYLVDAPPGAIGLAMGRGAVTGLLAGSREAVREALANP